MIKAKIFVAVRARIIGVVELIEAIGIIIVGTKMPGLTLKVMLWELESAPWRNWERKKVANILNPPIKVNKNG